jgi:hypothetical protein
VIRKRPSHATIVAYLALFLALGGTTYAATSLPNGSVGTPQLKNGAVTGAKLHPHSVTAFDVANHSLGGGQIKASTLGTVANAVHALNADHAINAGHATSAGHARKADHATNADKLGGSPASDLRLHCPNNLHQGADLCFDFKERTPAPLATALATCARARLRLPNEGELAEVFDNLGAQQDFEWVADHYFASNVSASGALLAQNTSRQILFNAGFASSSYPYRCVTSMSN